MAPVTIAALLTSGAIDGAVSSPGVREAFDVPIVPILLLGGTAATLGAWAGAAIRASRVPRADS